MFAMLQLFSDPCHFDRVTGSKVLSAMHVIILNKEKTQRLMIKGSLFRNFEYWNLNVNFVEPSAAPIRPKVFRVGMPIPELPGADSVILGHGRVKEPFVFICQGRQCGTVAPSRQSTAGDYSRSSLLTISGCVTLTHAFRTFVDERCHGRTSKKQTKSGGREKRKQPLRRTRVRLSVAKKHATSIR